MKLAPRAIAEFMKSAPTALGVLVYGPDHGLVHQRAATLASHVVPDLADPFLVTDVSGDTIQSESGALLDALSAMAFGGGRRLVRVQHVASGSGATFKNALKELPEGAEQELCLIATAGDLPPSSALRKLFEQDKRLVALPCYHDDVRDLETVAKQALAKHGIATERGVIPYLCLHCQGDRMVILQEIEKLRLFCYGKDTITMQDTLACIGDTTESSLDHICHAVADRDLTKLTDELAKAYSEGAMPVSILRAVYRYFWRLQHVIAAINAGTPQDRAVQALRPPVFFKQKAIFQRHLAQWKHAELVRFLQLFHALYLAEYQSKHTHSLPELLCTRALMRIASR